jgi:hypothetical protein
MLATTSPIAAPSVPISVVSRSARTAKAAAAPADTANSASLSSSATTWRTPLPESPNLFETVRAAENGPDRNIMRTAALGRARKAPTRPEQARGDQANVACKPPRGWFRAAGLRYSRHPPVTSLSPDVKIARH